MKRIIRTLLGILCISVGLVLGLLPFIPGILLVVIGLELIGIPIIPREKLFAFLKTLRRRRTRNSRDELE